MKGNRNAWKIGLSALVMAVIWGMDLPVFATPQETVTSPDQFFGFRLGSDKKIARWDKIVEYYRLLEREGNGKLKVMDMGPSTLGNPFLLVVISSPANLVRLETLRQVNLRLSNPSGLGEKELEQLLGEGKTVICQSMSLHATEIGGTQMAPELAFDLLHRSDTETACILDNVIFLLVPSFNPDGALMVSDWYAKTLGTEYEGSGLPWLYHKYAGHDNNRDAFQTNLVESRYIAKILFRDWIPQAYIDHHHMGSYGARIYLPPYSEPIRPLADPLIWREHSWYGAHMAYKEEEAGLSGILNMAQFSGWGHFGFHWITPFHNIAGMLTESASAKLATPLYIHPDQLEGDDRSFPAYEAQTTFPNPWPGGWWRLRDIVERQKVSAWALLDLAARNRETILRNAYLKAKRQTERGAAGKPAAFIIPTGQHDPLTAIKLINKLLIQGVEINRTDREIRTPAGIHYPAGSYFVSCAQPKMGLIRYLLGRTFYPDNDWTRREDGTPIRPYDTATDTMAEFMGVQVDPLDEAPLAGLSRVTAEIAPKGQVERGPHGYWFSGRANDSFTATSLLMDRGVTPNRCDERGGGLEPGDFFFADAPVPLLTEIAGRTGVDFLPLTAAVKVKFHPAKRMRTAMYQRFWGGNMDEGWTRLLLEQFSIPYTTLFDAEIRKGGLEARYDVIIIPDDSIGMITGEREESSRWRPDAAPPEYRSGIGPAGIEALKSFVQKGGTLVTLGRACQFAIQKLSLSLRDIAAGRNPKEFWCPGSTLHSTFSTGHPLAYGMPAEGLALYLGGNPVFEIVPGNANENYEVIAAYADRDLLRSGWLIGERVIAGKASVIAARYGRGRVFLYGFRPQHRAQTHGTYKLFFNALLN